MDGKTLHTTQKDRRPIAEKAKSLSLELPNLCSDLLRKHNLTGTDESIGSEGIDMMKKRRKWESVFLVVPAMAVPEVDAAIQASASRRRALASGHDGFLYRTVKGS